MYKLFIQFILDILFPPGKDRQIVRDLKEDILAQDIKPVILTICNPPVTGLLPFHRHNVRILVHEAKYRNNSRAIALLGNVLREYVMSWMTEESFSNIAIIPIPLSQKRYAERTYNQVEEIIRSGVIDIDIPIITNCLIRTRNTSPQTTLSKNERLSNMHNAFTTTYNLNPHITYIICDDVCTTGATLEAAALALINGGAQHILPLAITYS